MADELVEQGVTASPRTRPSIPNTTTFSSYLGLSFAVFLGLLPHSYHDHLAALHTRNRNLFLKLLQAEDQLRHMQSRRREDSKANARVVEIFATHRNAWQVEERRLLQQIDHLQARVGELEKSEAELGAMVEKLQMEVEEREEVIGFMSKRGEVRGEVGREVCVPQNKGGGNHLMEDYGSLAGRVGRIRVSEGLDPLPDICFSGRSVDADQMGSFLGCHSLHGFTASSCSAPVLHCMNSSDLHELFCYIGPL